MISIHHLYFSWDLLFLSDTLCMQVTCMNLLERNGKVRI